MIARKFPQYLSKPFQVLWFEVDELVLSLFFLTLSLLYGKWMWLIFLVFQYSYTKIKRSQSRGFLKHVLYVFGLVKMNNYPDYFQQEFNE